MKVLAVFPDLYDDNPGGVQVSGRIAWEMLQRDTDARALFVTSRAAAIREARAQQFRPDITLFWHLDLLRLAPFLRGAARRVVFLHGIEAWRRPGWLTHKLLPNTRFLANSRYTIARASKFMPVVQQTRAAVVHLGFGAIAATSAPLPAPPAAVMIGRMDSGERYKGHHEVISAWPAVLQRVPGAQLWIVGDGDLRAELEQLTAELLLTDAVRFFGRVSETEKETLMAGARCLVLPSRAEGFGIVYVEAMRAARPCIVGTDAGSEVVNPPEAGLSVDPANPAALTAALITLLADNAEWERMSQAARARYAAHFTAQQFQARLLDALRRIY